MSAWRKKPIVIEAFRLGDEWPDWWADAVSQNVAKTFNVDGRWAGGPDYATIKTLEGVMRAERGHWIIRGIKGEIYPCAPDIFAASYEPSAASPYLNLPTRRASDKALQIAVKALVDVAARTSDPAAVEIARYALDQVQTLIPGMMIDHINTRGATTGEGR